MRSANTYHTQTKKSIFFFEILISLFLFSCGGQNDISDKAPDLFPKPKTVELNTEDGYRINALTGDTIQPIILDSGDTLITGISIPAKGRQIHPDSTLPPTITLAGKPIEIPTNLNVHAIPENLTVINVDDSKLKKIHFTPSSDQLQNDGNYLINSIGDSILTGTTIPTKGKIVPTEFPLSMVALPPRMKDNAICDIQFLDVDQGMNSSYIVSMFSDRNGNIWFGTLGGGVSKYDGKSFTHFTEKEGLSNNTVRSILEDRNGNIWFGTFGGGVSKYDGKSFIHFTENEGLSNNTVWSIVEDKKGNLWFGTDRGGVSKYEPSINGQPETFTHITINEGLTSNTVQSILEDKKGNLWFGTYGGGVSMYDGKVITQFTENDGLSNNNILSIIEDKEGNIWLSCDGAGLSKYDGKSFTHFSTSEGLSNNSIRSMIADKKGNLWFGTDGGGVSCYRQQAADNSATFTHFTEKEGLTNNEVWSVVEDSNGNIWFGTMGGGVSCYDGTSFTHITDVEGLSNNTVLSILEDKNGIIWFGTYGGGLNKYDGKTFSHFSEVDGLLNTIIFSILEDRNGDLWLGTYGGGVTKYDGKQFTQFSVAEGLSYNSVRSIEEDQHGNLWFGTNGGGVTKYDGITFTHFTEKEGFSNNVVYTVLEDSKGNIWFATLAGLSKYAPSADGKSGTFIHFSEREGLSSNIIRSMLEDKNGDLWFGTYDHGVCKYEPSEDGQTGTFTYFTENEGFSNNTVWSILEDKNKSSQQGIWFSTEKGICRLTNDGTQMLRFNREDGLKGVDFFQNSVLLDSKNRIWWGSGQGLEMLDLNNYKSSEVIPQPQLRRLDINENFVGYQNLDDSSYLGITFDSVARFENYPTNLVLPYTQNHLTFHFSAIDWAAPHKIKYQYQLGGLDEKWSPVSDKIFADYRNIPYGEFTFKVRAIGESLVWSEPFEYTFTILPPWYHTWWARAIYILTGFLLIFLYIRWRTSKLKQRQKELERDIEKATHEIRHQKEAVEEAHKEITDSINYAERIQRSLMASKNLLDKNLKDYFIYFNPKEKVSGDFYWASHLDNSNFCLVAADSTGHGVPGAIMSMLNIASLEKAVAEKIISSSEILNHTRKTIIQTLANDGSAEGGKDGMDAALVILNKEKTKLEFSLANNPLWIIRPSSSGSAELIEYKPDKMPVGKHDFQNNSFAKNEVALQQGDLIYIFTDGFADQFGGGKGKKFKYSSLKELLLENSTKSLNEQKIILDRTFESWRGALEQVDDVCIIGIKV